MDKDLAKELKDIRNTIHECILRLNAFSDLRDDENEESIEETQVGLAETFEIAIASEESLTDAQMAMAELYEMIIEGGEV